jgi:hypothetical protein
MDYTSTTLTVLETLVDLKQKMKTGLNTQRER